MKLVGRDKMSRDMTNQQSDCSPSEDSDAQADQSLRCAPNG